MLSFRATGNTVQGSTHAAFRALAVELFGFPQCIRIDRDRGVQTIFIQRDPCKVLGNQFPRCGSTAFHRGLEFGNAGLDDGDRRDFGLFGHARAKQRREQDDQNESAVLQQETHL